MEAVLYDALGRRVAVLASGAFAAGRHALVLDAATARRLASGVYVVHVTARVATGASGRPASVAVRRLTLTR